MILASETDYVIEFQAFDPDEASSGVSEDLQLVSGVEGEIGLNKIGTTYYFTLTVDISEPVDLYGIVRVCDKHGNWSDPLVINAEVIQITGFEYQEKTPGSSNFSSLEDSHVVWQENTNRLRFLTSREINYDQSNDLNKFLALFDYQVKSIPWTYDSSTNTHIRSTTGWENFSGGTGVYSLKVEIYQKNTSTKIMEFEPDQYYCFNGISSVQWVTAASYTSENSDLQIATDGTNVKAFPEKSCGGVLKNIASVDVTLAARIPTGLVGTVHLEWFDPNNPIGGTKIPTSNGLGVRDNHGNIAFTPSTSKTLTWNNDTINQIARLEIGEAYAGDNYVVAAHPNDGVAALGQIDSSDIVAVPNTSQPLKQTQKLTVWRTLNVECDVMKHVLASIPDEDPINPVYCASIDGLVKTQLNRACVDVRYFVPNENNPPNATRSGSTWTNINVGRVDQGRDCSYNSQTFWSTRVISVPAQVSGLISEYEGASAGYFSASSNRICLVSDSMGPWINTWNVNHGTYVTLASYLEVTLLHEIGHWFELVHEQNVFFSTDGEAAQGEFATQNNIAAYYIHANNNEPDPIGIMNYLFRYTLPMPPIEPVFDDSPSGILSYVPLSAEPDVSRIIEYAYFTDANLTDIQKYGGE